MRPLAVIKALEACEVGDYRHAVEILLLHLERLDEPVKHRAICKACGRGFEWPGLLDAHYAVCPAWEMWAA